MKYNETVVMWLVQKDFKMLMRENLAIELKMAIFWRGHSP